MNNKDRADIAAKALLLVDECNVRDLLANLMHYCEREQFDFDGALNIARVHFAVELSEEAE